jgi:hypothetical protein
MRSLDSEHDDSAADFGCAKTAVLAADNTEDKVYAARCISRNSGEAGGVGSYAQTYCNYPLVNDCRVLVRIRHGGACLALRLRNWNDLTRRRLVGRISLSADTTKRPQ